MRTWPTISSFVGEQLRRVAMPLGGIGTGTVSIGGRGDLRDWEIMSTPAKGFVPISSGVHPHIAIRTVDDNGKSALRLCEGLLDSSSILDANGMPESNYGWPRFALCKASAAYPLMRIDLSDPLFPLEVRIEAFNPLIPGDTWSSALPIAIIRITATNVGREDRPATVCMGMPNFIGVDGSRRKIGWDGRYMAYGAERNRNRLRNSEGLQGVVLDSLGVSATDPAWGEIALAVIDDGHVTRRTHFASGAWGATLLDYWDDLLQDGALDERPDHNEDMPCAAVACEKSISRGESSTCTFLMSWRFPNRRSWTPDAMLVNHYSTEWRDAWSVIETVSGNLQTLENKTVQFVDSVANSSIPQTIADAALSNLTVLRSQTCFRLPGGQMASWEGVHDSVGSCHGSCTHVWNYEHVTPHLFPDLARGMREIEFLSATDERGCMSFRISLPLDREHLRKAAADGQLGCLVKLWREWRQGAGDEWLAKLWPKAKLAMEWCWRSGSWDADQDGVLEGCQHNTMDVEYYGPNPQMQGWYLAALLACSQMAEHLGEMEFSKRCLGYFANGSRFMDTELWNGGWYEQRVEACPKLPELCIHEKTSSADEYQLASGCLLDQLIGQSMASLYGLGRLHLDSHIHRTMTSIAALNRRNREIPNPMRSFAFDDESGLAMAYYKPGARPQKPFPYYAEVMTGFEYTAAIGMIQADMHDLAIRTVSDIRIRHDGRRRNPFSEPECGHHYVRSMASWGVLLAWTGQRWDALTGTLHIGNRLGRFPWCAGGSWGLWELGERTVTIQCMHGSLPLRSISFGGKLFSTTTMNEGSVIVVDISSSVPKVDSAV